jgi:hypothetical protein
MYIVHLNTVTYLSICLSVCLSVSQLVSQNMVNLIAGFPVRRSPSKFMNVMMWEHFTFDYSYVILRFGKVYYCNSIFITNFV